MNAAPSNVPVKGEGFMTSSTAGPQMPVDVGACRRFDDRVCKLGEGPIWHPLQNALFWVDILTKRILMRGEARQAEWTFDFIPSALGWVDEQTLLVATNYGLKTFDIVTEATRDICAIEADRPGTRSNDGCADPWGGFWVGTMNIDEGLPPGGAIYRWYGGELRQIVTGLKVPNGLCCDRSISRAFFSDSPNHQVWSCALDGETGWPVSSPELFLDFSDRQMIPDGATIDQQGAMWIAFWDSAKIKCYRPDATELQTLDVPVLRPTCPAFGGLDHTLLYFTSAATGLEGAQPQGMTFHASTAAQGIPSPQVKV